jgi:hypothetical protein
MKINYKHCLTLLFLLIAQITIGQVITVSGKVVDKGGLYSGANIIVKQK